MRFAARGQPLLSADKVWQRVHTVGLDDLLQFDWTLVGEADAFAATTASWPALDAIDLTTAQDHLTEIRRLVADRGRYLEILGLRVSWPRHDRYNDRPPAPARRGG